MLLQIETNVRCSAHCSFCPHDLINPRPDMPWEIIGKIISETKEYASTVFPCIYQEPLQEPRLLQILTLAKKINPRAVTAISSNMADMTRKKADQLIGCGNLDQIYVTFCGPTRELYRKYQPVLDWDTTRENIRYFCAAAKGTVMTIMNYLDIPDLMLYWDGFKNEWGNVADKVSVIKYETYGGSFKHREYQKETRGMCIRPWQGLTILSDGKVVPCNLDFKGTVSLGNAFSDNVMDIWTGEKFESFRQLHADGRYDLLPSLCKRCEAWKHS